HAERRGKAAPTSADPVPADRSDRPSINPYFGSPPILEFERSTQLNQLATLRIDPESQAPATICRIPRHDNVIELAGAGGNRGFREGRVGGRNSLGGGEIDDEEAYRRGAGDLAAADAGGNDAHPAGGHFRLVPPEQA